MMRRYSRIKQEPAALVLGKSGTVRVVVLGRDLRIWILQRLDRRPARELRLVRTTAEPGEPS